MGTMINEKYGVNIKRFYGGKDRGTCWAVWTSREGIEELTFDQVTEILEKWVQSVAEITDFVKYQCDIECTITGKTYCCFECDQFEKCTSHCSKIKEGKKFKGNYKTCLGDRT